MDESVDADEDLWPICEQCGTIVDPAEAQRCEGCGEDFHPECLDDHKEGCVGETR